MRAEVFENMNGGSTSNTNSTSNTSDDSTISTVCTVTPEWLATKIQDQSFNLLILDCRPPSQHSDGHISGALSIAIPASVIMLRRLASGKLSLCSLIKNSESRELFLRCWKSHTIILYDDDHRLRPIGTCVMATLLYRLGQDGCNAVCLEGGYPEFHSLYPEWCESCPMDPNSVEPSLLALERLSLDPSSAGTCDPKQPSCDSGIAPPGDSPGDAPFPVEILPHLFLGNAENSTNREALEKHNIRYVLNVTSNLPNTFQDSAGFTYMKIPIEDHWSQNLSNYFSQSIAFIDEARQKKVGILVHCVAGISRSVTVTLAYLMQKFGMPLNDAYDFVRQRKANISPNFNFMGQLMDFERQLNISPFRCSCQETPCKCQTLHFMAPPGESPDSGIDIDRWS